MTTKVVLECPDNSHWHVKVEVRDSVWDEKSQSNVPSLRNSDEFVLKQGEKREVYIHSTRRLIVTEIEPEAVG